MYNVDVQIFMYSTGAAYTYYRITALLDILQRRGGDKRKVGITRVCICNQCNQATQKLSDRLQKKTVFVKEFMSSEESASDGEALGVLTK